MRYATSQPIRMQNYFLPSLSAEGLGFCHCLIIRFSVDSIQKSGFISKAFLVISDHFYSDIFLNEIFCKPHTI